MADSFAQQSASEFARVSVTEEPMTESYVQQTMSETRDLFLESRLLGVFDRTYILLDYRSELYLIDQHAAHEKILYEEYTQAVANHEVSRQMLLLPFEMDMEKGAELPDLESLGF
ncbi:MAG: hypothetical protein Q4A41_02195, partial [Bacillota bacterium]|nr:hypothetical protein [Bacillota bacterium]